MQKSKGKSRKSEPAATFAFCVLPIAFCVALACGRKTALKPPELVRPQAIDNLAAAPVAEGIELVWQRPDRYADGSRMEDLGRFVIERSDAGDPFHTIATLPVTDRERFRKVRRIHYVDASPQPGMRYAYRVFSVTLDEYVSLPSNVAIASVGETPTASASASPTPSGAVTR